MKHIKGFKEFINECVSMDEFKEKLEQHDWFYNMSDDDEQYKKGQKEREELHDMAEKLGKEAQKMLQDKIDKVNKEITDAFN